VPLISRKQMKANPSKTAKGKAAPSAKKSTSNHSKAKTLTAQGFSVAMKALQSDKELEKIKGYFKTGKGEYGEGDQFMGVPMGKVFALAKTFVDMELDEIEKLLESPLHEMRAGGVSIMDFQARNKKTTESRRKELFQLYINRHDRINNWDLVDRSAPYVVGGYLFDKPRNLLYKLAKSKNVWERRTAIVSTYFFIRQGQVDDTFQIAEILLHDKHELIHKASGGWIREAGKKDHKRLTDFLDKYAFIMPRIMLRYALEHFDKKHREHYMRLKEKE
jgi:3-methyladenine DNA glycosylase AlkD